MTLLLIASQDYILIPYQKEGYLIPQAPVKPEFFIFYKSKKSDKKSEKK
jgi:hypothetical protein